MWVQSLSGDAVNISVMSRIVIAAYDEEETLHPCWNRDFEDDWHNWQFCVEVPLGANDMAFVDGGSGFPPANFFGDDVPSYTLASFDNPKEAKKYIAELIEKLNAEKS